MNIDNPADKYREELSQVIWFEVYTKGVVDTIFIEEMMRVAKEYPYEQRAYKEGPRGQGSKD